MTSEELPTEKETPVPEVTQNPIPKSKAKLKPGAGLVVWRWVSYGLWMWALLALAAVLTVTYAYFFISSGDNPFDTPTYTIYPLAALICLVPIAFVVDHLFWRREQREKETFSSVIVVINAVGVILVSVAGLVTVVVSALSLLVFPFSAVTSIVMAGAAVVTVLGALFAVRIIEPVKLRGLVVAFRYAVLGVAIVAVIAASLGPLKSDVTRKTDLLIENNLVNLSNDISDYYSTNSALPAKLTDIDFVAESDSGSNSGQALVQQNLVTYVIQSSTDGTYKLCVTYTTKLGSGTASTDPTYIDTSSHPAGSVCYEQNAGGTELPGGSVPPLQPGGANSGD